MFDRLGDATSAVDASGAAVLPGWAVAVAAAFILAVGVLASLREGRGWPLAGVSVVLVVLLAGWLALDQSARRDLIAERRALDQRVFELTAHALLPGSALACLDAAAGERVETACEKAIFANPETTAAAVSYVAAQLSLLAASNDYARRVGRGPAPATLRRAVEADRFGIVAHVLATRDGCTPTRCAAFLLLQDGRRIRANLVGRPFESLVEAHAAGWPAGSDGRPVASIPPAPATPAPPTAAAKPPNNLYFPSAASIPPVSIMTPEPAASAADKIQDKSQDKAQDKPRGATDEASAAPARKPPPGAPQARPPASAAPAHAAPLSLGPAGQ
jgi:hypothetical protein